MLLKPQGPEGEVVDSSVVGPSGVGVVSGYNHSSTQVCLLYMVAFKRVFSKNSPAVKRLQITSPDQHLPSKEETNIHKGLGHHPNSEATEPVLEVGPDFGSSHNAALTQLPRHRPVEGVYQRPQSLILS